MPRDKFKNVFLERERERERERGGRRNNILRRKYLLYNAKGRLGDDEPV